ncbi:MAG: GH3 auxin-responsive promoter family protein, partial [Dehalococcoidia bacterium]
MTDSVLSSVILAAAREPGEVNVKPGDRGIYNIAPKPYISGYVAQGMVEKFGFRSIPPLEEAEEMDFRQRVETGFEMALRTGVDIMCSLSSVLLKIGQRFTEHSHRGGFQRSRLHPAILYRFSRALLGSRLAGRGILPKDLWPLKAIIGWGLDTSLYGREIVTYWGSQPYEFHACTEVGILAQQAWNKKGLTPTPYAAFVEFLPEEEIGKMRRNHHRRPRTVLVDGLEPGRRYELIITSFYGMPFIRYRVGHLIKVLSKGDPETGVSLPQISFVGRADEAIDLAGFTRLDEKTIWQALASCPFRYEDWTVRREFPDGYPSLHLFIELRDRMAPQEVGEALHQSLRGVDPAYRDLEDMLGLKPLEVTLLPGGTFERYSQEMQRRGLELSQWRVGHLNVPEARMKELLD